MTMATANHCISVSAAFLNDALYCSEETWEPDEEVTDDCCFQKQEPQFSSNIVLKEQDLYWEDEELSSLLAKQEQNKLLNELETNSSLAKSRFEAVEWMLKVNARYSFTALTAVLAINYLDRFLYSFHLQTEKPWMAQLAAVACLSLAAKVEETQVPLLLDLQVEDSKYVFEAKTIQRMEILVLSTLQWRMNPVTPLSYLDYITRRLGFKNYVCWEFMRRCELVALSVLSDFRSMHYLPSEIATATMLYVITALEPFLDADYKSQLLCILAIDKDKINNCRMLIVELESSQQDRHSNKRKYANDPGSPNGVMDVSFSSDSSNDSWAVTGLSVTSSPEHHQPPLKKNRALPPDLLSIIPS